MNFRELNIPIKALNFFKQNYRRLTGLQSSNEFIQTNCGIINFFNSVGQLEELRQFVNENKLLVQEPDRRQYGDFQTNESLALQCVRYILSKTDTEFEFLLEPTCGKGNFILAALSEIITLKKVVGVEIYEPYVWDTKFKILDFYIKKPQKLKPEIEIFHANVFDFDFEVLSGETDSLASLVIGNLPG
ncbi:MAG: hypothetical protein GY795_49780 [Desulfobacterales bacterium]|nr:hypothetical protein [Desulfobacterales bacterium]